MHDEQQLEWKEMNGRMFYVSMIELKSHLCVYKKDKNKNITQWLYHQYDYLF